jgi:hypothetical protein
VHLKDRREHLLDEGYRHHGMARGDVGHQAVDPDARNRRVSDERVKQKRVDLAGHAGGERHTSHPLRSV